MKTLDIEKLLVWAYREELPKLEFLGLGVSNFTLVSDRIELMTFQVGDGRRRGEREDSYGFSGLTGYAPLMAEPHPDARILHAAVKGLDDPAVKPVIEEPAALLSDMPEAVQAEAEGALSGYRVQLACLVMRHARMGTRPDWRCEAPERKPVMGARGDAPAWFVMEDVLNRTGGTVRMEVPGYDRIAKRPKPGAYRKFVFEPAVRELVDLRADYLCWRAGLAWIAESVQLTAHRVTGPEAPAWPWEGERERGPARVIEGPGWVAPEEPRAKRRRKVVDNVA